MNGKGGLCYSPSSWYWSNIWELKRRNSRGVHRDYKPIRHQNGDRISIPVDQDSDVVQIRCVMENAKN